MPHHTVIFERREGHLLLSSRDPLVRTLLKRFAQPDGTTHARHDQALVLLTPTERRQLHPGSTLLKSVPRDVLIDAFRSPVPPPMTTEQVMGVALRQRAQLRRVLARFGFDEHTATLGLTAHRVTFRHPAALLSVEIDAELPGFLTVRVASPHTCLLHREYRSVLHTTNAILRATFRARQGGLVCSNSAPAAPDSPSNSARA